MTVTVDYFMTTSSPWSYLGARRFMAMTQKVGAEVNVYAVDFGQIFSQSGGLPLPKRAPQRRAYRLVELARWKRHLGLPIVIEPENFPAKTPLSAHLVTAARLAGGDALLLSTLILESLWEQDRSIDDESVLADCCQKAGLDGASLIKAAKSEETKAAFAEDTELALHRGVFGAPSFIIDEELFWGQDRLDFVAEKLGAA
ncbi:2-hydroxychromene-2-carboxylate isomerase [Nisaea nitritireducens]|uniref:2-hydroxychromene-2-carboxylate isomerase n=1 Tax=Nisaea nitritireducens TaxID=568392 RepID=UPI0018681087|nr:2-hydroxychromene-2-carboxylate isomerase [Nisaea nitritireducens]